MNKTRVSCLCSPTVPSFRALSKNMCAIIAYASQSNGIHALIASLKKKRKICDFSLVISERFSSAGWLLGSILWFQLQVSSPNEPQITKTSESHLVSIQNHVLRSFQNRPRSVQKIHEPWQTFQWAWFKFLCLYCVVLLWMFLMVLVRNIIWIHYNISYTISCLHLMVDAHVLIHIYKYSYMHSWELG